MKRLFLAGVIASGCLLPRLEVDPSLLGSGAGLGGDAQGQAGTHNGEHGGSSSTGGSGAHGPAGGSPDQATGGAEAGAPDEATAGTTLGGGNVGGGAGSVGGGTPGGGTAGSGTAGSGGSGMLGEQVGAFTLFRTFGVDPTNVALGSDNNLWITDDNGNISRVTQAGDIKTFTLPVANKLRNLQAIVAGPDGALWFTDFANKVVGRISLVGEITFLTPTMTLQGSIGALVTAPDGYLWGSALNDNVVFRLSTAGVFKFFAPTVAQGQINADEMASNKSLIYAVEHGRAGITAINSAGEYTPLDFPSGHAIANGLAIGSDGQVWFSTGLNNIGKTSPAGVTVDYPVTSGIDVFNPVAGPDNHMWFIDVGATRGAGQLLRVSYDGKIDYVPYPAQLDTPNDMIAGGSNDLWLTCGTNTANVARLDISKL